MQRHSPCQRLLSLTLTLCLLLSGMTLPAAAYPDQTFAYDAAGNRSSVVATPQTSPATTPPALTPPPAGGTAASGGAGSAAVAPAAGADTEEDASADPPAAPSTPAPTTPPAPAPAPTPAAPAATTTAYTANNLNQYTRVGTATHTHDKNGNRTSDGTITYRWDAENRLTGAVVWSSHHEPFGKAHIQTGPDGDGTHLAFPFRFPGQYEDAETGPHYNRHRYYDPQIDRYLSPDLLSLRSGNKILLKVGNFLTVVADEASFGLGPLAREYLEEKFGLGGHVNPCSSAYTAGGWARFALGGARAGIPGASTLARRLAPKGAALVVTNPIGYHAAQRLAKRGITPAMAHKAIERGARYFDRTEGTVSYILQSGLASGKTLQVVTNLSTGKVVTGMVKKRFNPNTQLPNDTLRYLRIGD